MLQTISKKVNQWTFNNISFQIVEHSALLLHTLSRKVRFKATNKSIVRLPCWTDPGSTLCACACMCLWYPGIVNRQMSYARSCTASAWHRWQSPDLRGKAVYVPLAGCTVRLRVTHAFGTVLSRTGTRHTQARILMRVVFPIFHRTLKSLRRTMSGTALHKLVCEIDMHPRHMRYYTGYIISFCSELCGDISHMHTRPCNLWTALYFLKLGHGLQHYFILFTALFHHDLSMASV